MWTYKHSIAVFFFVFVILCAVQPAQSSEILPDGIQAQALADTDLEEIRGKFMGFYFSMNYSMYWDTSGNQFGMADAASGTNTNLVRAPGDSSVQLNNPLGTSTAVIGDFQGGSGIFQINQVPGNNNLVNNSLVLDIAIFTLQESQIGQMQNVLQDFLQF